MRKGTLNGIAALGLSGLALAEGVDGADTAWMLVSTALVLLMTPALAFFYGGLVRSKNALNTMMMSFAAQPTPTKARAAKLIIMVFKAFLLRTSPP